MLTSITALKECAERGNASRTVVRQPRAMYVTPRLLDYGRLVDLTAGGSSARQSEVFNGCNAQAFLFRC